MFDRSREKTESVLEKTLFADRWLLAPFYLGLAIDAATSPIATSPANSGVAEAPAQGKT